MLATAAFSGPAAAGRLWRVFGEPESAESRAGVRAGAARALSHSQLSGGSIASYCASTGSISTSGMFGIDDHAEPDSRFQRCWFLIPLILGRCPRLVVNCAFGAKPHPHQAGNARVYFARLTRLRKATTRLTEPWLQLMTRESGLRPGRRRGTNPRRCRRPRRRCRSGR
jgi:hypothetical protein